MTKKPKLHQKRDYRIRMRAAGVVSGVGVGMGYDGLLAKRLAVPTTGEKIGDEKSKFEIGGQEKKLDL